MNGYFCRVCGKALEGKQRAVCSKECRWKESNSQIKEYKSFKTIKRTKPKYSLAEINKMARVENLTYGQFMAKYRDKII